jgi:hypothetical protein
MATSKGSRTFLAREQKALRNPGINSKWEWVNWTGLGEGDFRLDIRPLEPLRTRRMKTPESPTRLWCRVIAPDGSVWDSFEPSPSSVPHPATETMRFYPAHFRCPACRQPPAELTAGTYWVEWWKVHRVRLFNRPLLRYYVTR